MRDKRGIEFSFTWLFALIVGAIILFAAIYAAINFIGTGQDTGQTKAAKELSIIFNPLETGTASGKKPVPINFNTETRVYNKCSESGSFGNQKFSISQKSFGRWSLPGGEITVYNKYVFSDNVTEGKKVYYFSKPFEMPFKVSELIYMTTKNYCFVDAPGFIVDEVSSLELGNVRLENCSAGDVRVCFGNGNCDIRVYGDCSGDCNSDSGEYEYGHTVNHGETLYYVGSLLYGTVFSSPEVYNCNFNRLMLRLKQVSYLYKDEASFIVSRGCGDSSLAFIQLAEAAAQASNSTSIGGILNLRDVAGKVDEQNSAESGCSIY